MNSEEKQLIDKLEKRQAVLKDFLARETKRYGLSFWEAQEEYFANLDRLKTLKQQVSEPKTGSD